MNLKPWRWLAEVTATAAEGSTADRVLALRTAFATWFWRRTWQERYDTVIRRSAGADMQFAEEVSLIPPPDDIYAIIIGAGSKAVATVDDAITVVRANAADARQPWTLATVARLLASDILDMTQKGWEFDPQTISGMSIGLRSQDAAQLRSQHGHMTRPGKPRVGRVKSRHFECRARCTRSASIRSTSAARAPTSIGQHRNRRGGLVHPQSRSRLLIRRVLRALRASFECVLQLRQVGAECLRGHLAGQPGITS
jgi:hypothetical protein